MNVALTLDVVLLRIKKLMSAPDESGATVAMVSLATSSLASRISILYG